MAQRFGLGLRFHVGANELEFLIFYFPFNLGRAVSLTFKIIVEDYIGLNESYFNENEKLIIIIIFA